MEKKMSSEDNTTEHVCPEHITKLFDADPETARVEAVKWAASLSLQAGARVWLPEIGWQEYRAQVGHA